MYTIYTQAGRSCHYCMKAAALLEAKALPFSVSPLDKPELLEVAAQANMTTVPIIYKDTVLVGGFSELQALLV